jgi:arylsulfatase A-like enzyme
VPADPPDIVLIVVDSLRADHLGCYGYDRPTSPNVDALADDGVVFDAAFAAGIPTTPSFTTLYTGLHPYRHGIVAHYGERRLSEDILLLPQLAKRRGYLTTAVDSLVVQSGGRGSWFARGYDHYAGFHYEPFGGQSSRLTDAALRLVEERTDKPHFLFVHYWDPHTPYGPLPPYDTMHYEPGSGAYDMSDVVGLCPEYYEAFIQDMNLEHPDDYAYVVAQYDGEISQVDVQIGRLIAGIKDGGSWENTVLLLVSDHGECFGEGDFHFDHHGLYDAVTRVPIILHAPGLRPSRIRGLASTEDVLPTLADLAGLPLPDYDLTGESLLPHVQGAPPIRRRIVSSESTRQASLALRTESWKLILPITEDAEGRPIPDFYDRPRPPDPLLFDLQADPTEEQNLAPHMPEKLFEMRRELEDWRGEMAEVTDEPDPIQAQGLGLPYERFMRRVLNRR